MINIIRFIKISSCNYWKTTFSQSLFCTEKNIIVKCRLTWAVQKVFNFLYLFIAILLMVPGIDSLDQLTTEFSLKQYSPVHVTGFAWWNANYIFWSECYLRSTRHITCEHKQRMFEEIVAVKKFSNYLNLTNG